MAPDLHELHTCVQVEILSSWLNVPLDRKEAGNQAFGPGTSSLCNTGLVAEGLKSPEVLGFLLC